MKFFLSLFILISATFFVNAQIDSRNNSMVIPAIESEKQVENNSTAIPLEPKVKNNSSNLGNLNVPKPSMSLEAPKKTFTLFSEKFGNPGELYTKQLEDQLANTKLSPEEVEMRNGSLTDQYFGDFKSTAKFVNVSYRDHGAIDGDIIQVRLNDDVVEARVFLTGGFKGLKLDLKKGFNKIDFVALNQGSSGPNTAQFRVVDDLGNVISSNQWNLSTGVKATIIIVKE